MVPTSPAPIRCERVSSTTTRAGAVGAVLDAAGEAGLDGGGDAGAVEAGAELVDVPAGGGDGGGDDGAAEDTGAEVDVLACLGLELHAAANAMSATRDAARK
jgi:hypothetical protein